MASIQNAAFGVFKEAVFDTLGRAITTVLISIATTYPALSQGDGSTAEPVMCSRLKELTTEFPNPVADRAFPKLSPEERCRQYFWHAFKTKPLNEILNASEMDIYGTAIAERECQTAMGLFSQRFAETHPEAKFILKEKKEFEFWQQIFVSHHFDELYLCQRLAEIDEAQRGLDRARMDITPYRGSPFSRDDVDNIGKRSGQFDARIEARDRPVAVLLEVNLFGKSPVYSLALLRLSQAGVALELHPLWELFLAFRLRDAGVSDPLVTSILSRPVDPKVRAEIERHAKDELAGWFQVPVHPHRAYPKKATPD